MGRAYTGARRKEPGQLRSAQLPQSVERLHPGKRIDLDQRELYLAQLLCREPVQQLNQLQLVKQVVFEPENHLIVLAEIFQRLIARRKTCADTFVAARAKAGQGLRAHVGKLAQRGRLRDRAVVQDVDPGKI